jgi:predicted ribosome quality control (RQC) complex YloA/Tae2 family protein
MKSWSLFELFTISEFLQIFRGAQIQDVITTKTQIGIKIYKAEVYWLFFDMKATEPLFLFFPDQVWWKKKTTIPLLLFFRSHFVGKKLRSVQVDKSRGRVLLFDFVDLEDNLFQIEARLFPHGQNLILKTPDKKISYGKVKDLPASVQETWQERANWDALTALNEKTDLYFAKKKSAMNVTSAQELFEKEKLRIERQLLKMQEDIEHKKSIPYIALAQKLQRQQNLQVDEEEKAWLDLKKSWQENMQNLFQKHKDNQEKIASAEKRFAELEVRLRGLSLEEFSGKENEQKEDLFSAGTAKGRAKDFSFGRAYVGKSGTDNLALLRRAKAWYLWMHLRDLPGAHLILQKNKNQMPSTDELHELANWLVKESGFAKHLQDGDAYDVQYTECRFVRPIKGDSHGRVNYQNEKVLRFRYKSS